VRTHEFIALLRQTRLQRGIQHFLGLACHTHLSYIFFPKNFKTTKTEVGKWSFSDKAHEPNFRYSFGWEKRYGKKITTFEILFGAFTVGCDNGAQILSLEIMNRHA